MRMSGVVKSKLSVFFPHGTVNTLFFVGFLGDLKKKAQGGHVWWFLPVWNSENVFLVFRLVVKNEAGVPDRSK